MKIKKAVILAAGHGTRMLPATKAIPKEMLTVIDKPGIQYVVEEAANSGIEDILIITSHGKESTVNHFTKNEALEKELEEKGKTEALNKLRAITDIANVSFAEQYPLNGMGHAITFAKEFTGDEPFAVLSGDDIIKSETPVIKQLIDASEKYDCACVGVQEVSAEEISKYCTLDVEYFQDNVMSVKKLIEKPNPEQVMSNYSILGRYILTKDIYEILENQKTGYGGEIQLTDALDAYAKTKKLLAVDFCGARYDIGSVYGYLETVIKMGLEDEKIGAWLRDFLKKLEL